MNTSTRLIYRFAITTIFVSGCAQKLPDMATNASTSGVNNNPPVINQAWAANDAFVYTDLPVALQSQMVATLLADGYAAHTGPKAVAIANNGLGFVRKEAAPATQAETEKNALDACYAITGGKPCALIARGNAWAVGANDLPNSYSHVLPVPATAAAANIPFLSVAKATAAAAEFTAATAPKAMAISLNGEYTIAATNASGAMADIDEARRLALERCEMLATAIPCVLFNSGTAVDFTPNNINRSLLIDYTRTLLSINVPGSRLAAYVTGIQNDYLRNGGATNGVVYISAGGSGGYAYGTANNNANALANCSSRTAAGYPCFRYAVNRTISSLLPNLAAVKKGNPYNCQIVPRASCAQHRALGCPAGGTYYTVSAGTIALETCN